MSFPSKIVDGGGTNRAAVVTENNELKVTVAPFSAASFSAEDITRQKYFTAFATDSVGSFDLAVDGSSTPVSFSVRAVVGQITWVTRIRFLFNGTQLDMSGPEARRFGPAAGTSGLTNGLKCWVEQGGIVSEFYNEPVTHMNDFWSYTDEFVNAIGAIAANTDFLSWDIDLPKAVAIPASSSDRIVVQVRDDLTSFDLFQVVMRGWKEFV